MSEFTVNYALRALGYSSGQFTGHGFRSMATTLLNEHGWDTEAIERQLGHVESKGVKAAYNYAQHLPLRQRMMQWWADHLDELRALLPPTSIESDDEYFKSTASNSEHSEETLRRSVRGVPSQPASVRSGPSFTIVEET